MLGAVAASTSLCFSPSTYSTRIVVLRRISNSTLALNNGHSFLLLSAKPMHFSSHKSSRRQPHFLAQAAASSGQVLWSLSFVFFSFIFCFLNSILINPHFQLPFLCFNLLLGLFLQLLLGNAVGTFLENEQCRLGNKL